MKTQIKFLWRGFAAIFALSATLAGAVEADSQTVALKQSLQGIPAPEIPAKAAAFVAQSKASEQERTALAALHAGMELAPAATPELVGSIARQAPPTAPAVAGEAASRHPKMAPAIAKAAVVSAPDYTGKIIAAINKRVPSTSGKVTRESVLATLPAGHSLLREGLASPQPALSTDVATVAPAGPNQGVPFVPGGGKPGETNRNKVIVVEKGKGRIKDYSSP